MIIRALTKSFLITSVLATFAPVAFCAASQKTDPVQDILNLLSQKSGMVPQAIYQYKYKSKIVYFTEMPCCDQYNILFNKNIVEICAPSGGFAGNGDGKCPDFEDKKSSQKLLWKRK
jgi:hypothetical protein